MQTYGCERCGKYGAALQPINLSASGRLVVSTVVHIHADKHRPTPFVIGVIALDDGPAIRALLTGDIPPRSRVVGEFVPISSDDGSQLLDLRFKPAE